MVILHELIYQDQFIVRSVLHLFRSLYFFPDFSLPFSHFLFLSLQSFARAVMFLTMFPLFLSRSLLLPPFLCSFCLSLSLPVFFHRFRGHLLSVNLMMEIVQKKGGGGGAQQGLRELTGKESEFFFLIALLTLYISRK